MLKQVTDRPEKARQSQPQEQKEDQVIEEADPSPPVVRHEPCPKAQVLGQGQEAAHLLVDGKVDVGLVLAPIDGFDGEYAGPLRGLQKLLNQASSPHGALNLHLQDIPRDEVRKGLAVDGVDEGQALDEDPRERFGAFLGSRFLGRSFSSFGGL